MDGIIIINKEKGITSRDLVNMVCKKLNTNKVGHTGTLDPLATGLMVLCVGDACKLVELLTNHDKEYIAKVKLGISTNTFDITGEIEKEDHNYKLDSDTIEKVLNSFKGEYLQTVPIYSSIKINGKKLYEYAREKKEVELPKHLVKIMDIKLLSFNNDSFTFKVKVSSGTYIRSLINDISRKLSIPMAMEELQRTCVGNYKLGDSCSIDNIKIIPILDAINLKKIEVNDDCFLKKISNGVKIKNIYNEQMVLFIKNKSVISIYQDMGNGIMRSYRVFKKS